MSGSLIKVCPTQYIHTCTLYMYRCILLAGNLEWKLQAIILDTPYKYYGLSEIVPFEISGQYHTVMITRVHVLVAMVIGIFCH